MHKITSAFASAPSHLPSPTPSVTDTRTVTDAEKEPGVDEERRACNADGSMLRACRHAPPLSFVIRYRYK
jgi:hypothetical protein